MSVQLLLASVAGILFLLMCMLGVIYLIDAIRIKKENKSCIDTLCNFVGMEGYFDTRSKVFFQVSPKNPIMDFEKCQFPDFDGHVPYIIPCKIAGIYPASRSNPEFEAYIDLDIKPTFHICANILYVGNMIVVFEGDSMPETAMSKVFFAKKDLKQGDVINLNLFITKNTVKSFICDILPGND